MSKDYYPFGMVMPGRKFTAGTQYRYGFNGKENDNEVKGDGNQQDYGMRIYDPRLGRFLSVDPLTNKFVELTPYQFASNSPISSIDVDGQEAQWYVFATLEEKLFGTTHLKKIQTGFNKRAEETVNSFVHGFIEAIKTLPVTTALGGTQYAKTLGGNQAIPNAKDIKKYPPLTLSQVAKPIIEDYKELLSKAARGDEEAIGGVVFETAMLFVPFESGPAKGGATFTKITRGLAFFDETTRFTFNTVAKEFEESTIGAMSNIQTKKRFVPGLFFDNPNPRGRNYVKFDSYEISGDVLILIDAKYNVTTFSKQIKDIQRMSEALQQNPRFGSLNVTGVLEVPNESARRAATKALEKAGVDNISVRIRK